MLTKSAITPQEDPEAVLDILEIHTDHQERELDPEMDIGMSFHFSVVRPCVDTTD
jgi:hypothetical protein